MSAAVQSANPKRVDATNASVDAVELTAEGLQWMLQGVALISWGWNNYPAVRGELARCVPCEVWLNAYDAAPDAVRQSLTHSVTAGGAANAWAPPLWTRFTAIGIGDPEPFGVQTPLHAFTTAARLEEGVTAPLSDAAVARLFRVLQCVGLFAAADRDVFASALYHCADRQFVSRASELLIADPNADAALPGPTRCSAGDAHIPPRHHSVRCGDEQKTLHDVLFAAAGASSAGAPGVAAWRAFTDVRLPFAARAMDEEWAYARTGPCGCAGWQRVGRNPLNEAITCGCDEAGEWLAARLPAKRLHTDPALFDGTPDEWTALIAAMRDGTPMPRTVAALLSRVPDVDLTRRIRWDDNTPRTAAERLNTRFAPQWLSPELSAELKLKTQQFGAQYLPSAAVLCVEALCGAVSVPRELVSLVLQYTALPQPNPWPHAHTEAGAAVREVTALSAAAVTTAAAAGADTAAACGAAAADCKR